MFRRIADEADALDGGSTTWLLDGVSLSAAVV